MCCIALLYTSPHFTSAHQVSNFVSQSVKQPTNTAAIQVVHYSHYLFLLPFFFCSCLLLLGCFITKCLLFVYNHSPLGSTIRAEPRADHQWIILLILLLLLYSFSLPYSICYCFSCVSFIQSCPMLSHGFIMWFYFVSHIASRPHISLAIETIRTKGWWYVLIFINVLLMVYRDVMHFGGSDSNNINGCICLTMIVVIGASFNNFINRRSRWQQHLLRR